YREPQDPDATRLMKARPEPFNSMSNRKHNAIGANGRAARDRSAGAASLLRRPKLSTLLLLAIVSICVYGLAVADEPAAKDQAVKEPAKTAATFDALNDQEF